MARKGRYSSGQKKAYYSGMGYSMGYNHRSISFGSSSNYQSFRDGYRAGIASLKKNPRKYPKLK